MRVLVRWSCLAIVIGLSACGRAQPLSTSAALPALAALTARTSSATDLNQSGEQAALRSPDNASILPDGTLALTPTAAAPLAWAIFEFHLGGRALHSTLVEFDERAGNWDSWLCSPDFVNNRWVLHGAYNSLNPAPPITASEQANWSQPSGIYYLAVVTSFPHTASVKSVTLSVSTAEPVAQLTATPATGAPGQATLLDASASTDADGAIVLFEWDVDGDGAYDLNTGALPTLNRTLPSPSAEYDVSVRITDDDGLSATAQATLSSLPCPPVGPLDIGAHSDQQPRPYGLLLVDAHPAIVWSTWHVDGFGLMYQRALTPDGSIWGEPVMIAPTDGVYYADLDLVAGNPAVVFSAPDYLGAWYIRALDSAGTQWGEPVRAMEGLGQSVPELAEVAGHPAIANWEGSVTYVRARDTAGTDWPQPLEVSTLGPSHNPATLEFNVLDGRPAISWMVFDTDGYDFVTLYRAEDPAGAAWPTAGLSIPTGTREAGQGFHARTTIAGHPAIVTRVDETQARVLYSRAQDPAGIAWDAFGEIASFDPFGGGDMGDWIGFTAVGAVPAVTYFDSGSQLLMFAAAADAFGADWESPRAIDDCGGQYSALSHLIDLDGCPVVCYRKIWGPGERSLRFAKGF